MSSLIEVAEIVADHPARRARQLAAEGKSMERVSFDDQVVIVTGAGRGLGRAYCLELAARGAAVVVNDVVAESADAVVAEIRASGGKALASHESVATPEGGQAIVDAAVGRFERVDAVINNAGILRNNLFEDMTLEQIDAVLDVNLRGSLFVTQPCWRIMKANGYGRVVFTSSAAGLFSRPGSVNYSAAKAAMYGLCKALSFEGAEHGIKVNTVLPRATSKITASDPIPGMSSYYSKEMTEALRPRNAPEATAPLVAYLASAACSVTGEAYSSAFGRYARVFVGLSAGWLAPDVDAISVEDVVQYLDVIRDQDGYTVPLSNLDETATVAAMLGVPTG
jgi:NAD(P)-dependent dehydrogenase (short-subunit alcohol dehydrogenase family)